MPRYFFHIHNGLGLTEDEEGQELASPDAAIAAAREGAPDGASAEAVKAAIARLEVVLTLTAGYPVVIAERAAPRRRTLRDKWMESTTFEPAAQFTVKIEGATRASGFADCQYVEHAAARQPNEGRAHSSLHDLINAALSHGRIGELKKEGAGMTPDQAVVMATVAADLLTEKRY